MKRKKEIIHLLLDANEPVTTMQMSTQFHVSSRTIRNDLLDIEAEILSNQLKLVKKPRVGVWIEGSSQHKNAQYLHLCGMQTSVMNAFSKESRRTFILSKLMLGRSRLHIAYFAQALYASQSTIKKDLPSISAWLKRHNLQLEREDDRGLYITGEEFDIRNTSAILVNEMVEQNKSIETMMMDVMHVDICKIQKKLQCWAVTHKLAFGEANLKNLAVHIAIMMNRIQQHREVSITKDIQMQMAEIKKQEVIQDFIQQMEEITTISISCEESDYILLHLIGMSLDNDKLLTNNVTIAKLKQQASDISDEFIANIEKIVCLRSSSIEMLRESLRLHLLPTMYRLNYGLNLYNPLLHEIKENYASAFALASIINSSFKKNIGVLANDEEIAFITLHISMAIQQTKKIPTIAVVCPMGRGISRFLLGTLEKNFPHVNFLSYSSQDILQGTNTYIDMVISTIPLTIEMPCITIRAMLLDEDINMIKAMIRTFDSTNKKMFSLQTIVVEHDNVDKLQVLQNIAQRLTICNYVDSTFLEGVLKREKMGSTEVGHKIVLTHGFHESVKRSQIAFCKLDHSILWSTQQVQFIVMLAIEKKDAKSVMQMDWLYKALNKDTVVKKLLESTTAQELYHHLLDAYEKF